MQMTRSKCFLYKNENELMEKKEIPQNTIVLALEKQPNSGHLALVRVIHEGNVWVLNSNLVKLYKTRTK